MLNVPKQIADGQMNMGLSKRKRKSHDCTQETN
jgi:hypothetical protein